MPDLDQAIRALSPAKALTILAYGESVAAYRYRTLADRAPTPALRAALEEMADEEQGHHQFIQKLISMHFPGADFVLAEQDKALVTVGARQLSFSAEDAFPRALDLIQETERVTGGLYARLSENPPHADLGTTFREMAAECFEHADRIKRLAAEVR